MNGNLKIAIQKKGRLTEKSFDLFKSCMIDIESYKERLLVTARNFKLDILFLRDDDIPEYVMDGVADLGIVGENVVVEKGADIEVIQKLGYGRCKLMLAGPEDVKLGSSIDLENKIIATSYPEILGKYLDKQNVNAKIIELSGSVEIAPSLGVADFICDLVSTGTTLKMNKLKPGFTVFNSEAVLIANNSFQADAEKATIFSQLMKRVTSVLTAKKSKYLMMNVEEQQLDKVLDILPSLKSPTVLPLADKNLFAIHAVVPSAELWEIVEKLKDNGASGILQLPVENLIP